MRRQLAELAAVLLVIIGVAGALTGLVVAAVGLALVVELRQVADSVRREVARR